MNHEEFIIAFQRLCRQVDRIDAMLTDAKNNPTTPTPSAPSKGFTISELEVAKGLKCPLCSSPVAPRRRKSDGAIFYGCSTFPQCRGIVTVVPAKPLEGDMFPPF